MDKNYNVKQEECYYVILYSVKDKDFSEFSVW